MSIASTPSRQAARPRSERGYSLIEVIVAMGVLATVMMGIVTLFFLARRNVYAGKQMTHAISVNTRMMEDLSAMSVATLYSNFGVTDTTTLGDVTVQPSGMPDSTYEGSIVRSTHVSTGSGCTGATPITFTGDTAQFLRRWYCQMNSTSNQLQNGNISVIITPRQQHPTTATLSAANATVVRVRTIIRWKEAARPRQVIMDTVKVRRPFA